MGYAPGTVRKMFVQNEIPSSWPAATGGSAGWGGGGVVGWLLHDTFCVFAAGGIKKYHLVSFGIIRAGKGPGTAGSLTT